MPDEVQGYISKGLISLGHAKIILGVEDPVQQTILARRVIENGLNVRNTEEVLKRMKNDSARKTPGTHASSAAQTARRAESRGRRCESAATVITVCPCRNRVSGRKFPRAVCAESRRADARLSAVLRCSGKRASRVACRRTSFYAYFPVPGEEAGLCTAAFCPLPEGGSIFCRGVS